MDKVLREYFHETSASDIYPYGYASEGDFLKIPLGVASFDWVITNPPFNLAEEFVARALSVARRGVAILARTVFMESVGRYERLFQPTPPAIFAQFVERVPMVKGRLDPKASTATGYAWFVWLTEGTSNTRAMWIPPCRKKLETKLDYDLPPGRMSSRQAQSDLFGFNVPARYSEAKRRYDDSVAG
ncbi:SAM-dependent methyltransferase [Mesorhizobium sp. MSK_1335]|uniref:SAM-dependent methyltransferase n=1 Tax=Mesorhizobium montanum TaxID=3072323 RepID=A0ABU4ZRW5_9HYPH|nr:SAM-dependent methyltransferase [Mesorhizobium sp. MSK_1335]MDX8526706.1 SAM-dependent methyltransferase [Mesorhizobium sp. MSK_1335]